MAEGIGLHPPLANAVVQVDPSDKLRLQEERVRSAMKIFYQHTLCVAVVFLSCFVVGGHATTKLERLMAENKKLKQLNVRLKELVRAKVGSSRIANRVANSPSFLELKEGSSSGIQAEEDPAKASNPKKKCVDIDDMAGVGEAENNFCLAPDMCRETLYSCKRNCVNRCWVEKYGKNGAPPGYGDIDQSRLSVINQRVKQMLQQVNIDLDCRPCSSTKEQATPAPTQAPKPKPAVKAVKKPIVVAKGGDAEGDVKLGLIEELGKGRSPSGERPTGPKFVVISSNHQADPAERRKQQLKDEAAKTRLIGII